MKATFNRESLAAAFHVAAGVSKSSPKPILANVKMQAGLAGVSLSATDLEASVRIDVPGAVAESPGDVLLPAGRVGAILSESQGDSIVLEGDQGKLEIHTKQGTFRLPTENPDEFPVSEAIASDAHYLLPAPFLREAIRRTVFAAAAGSSRWALGGILIEVGDQECVVIATDGKALAVQSGQAEVVGNPTGPASAIIPIGAAKFIARAIGDTEERVRLAISPNAIVLQCDGTDVWARQLEGRFPNWRAILPDNKYGVRVEMNAGDFLRLVRQAAIVGSEDHRGVNFTFSDGRVVAAAQGGDRGELQLAMPVDYSAASVSFLLDPRRLVDFLRVLDSAATFTLVARDAESIVVCELDDYRYGVMPIG